MSCNTPDSNKKKKLAIFSFLRCSAHVKQLGHNLQTAFLITDTVDFDINTIIIIYQINPIHPTSLSPERVLSGTFRLRFCWCCRCDGLQVLCVNMHMYTLTAHTRKHTLTHTCSGNPGKALTWSFQEQGRQFSVPVFFLLIV